jgi:hypothetical protein
VHLAVMMVEMKAVYLVVMKAVYLVLKWVEMMVSK